ncbi:MAG TPA: N-formylglutamate amidohydrolase [Gemmatimonadales bacterium]|nr:N-formylglutamate amidohydrolase [Gemmatimonadales bacterium]
MESQFGIVTQNENRDGVVVGGAHEAIGAPFLIELSRSTPVAVAAIHDGHTLRDEVAALMALSDEERLREEDPYTAQWTNIGGTRLTGVRSRFEVDLNRPRSGAVYLTPEESWGLRVWTETPASGLVRRSLQIHDEFYDAARIALNELRDRWNRFVVLDIHSYNHRRNGPDAAPASPAENPTVNIGTGSMNRALWGRLTTRFMNDMRGDSDLDVRENVRFQGGYFSRWVNETFPESGCALAIEFKKVFMDEWTGEPNPAAMKFLRERLTAAIPGLLEELQRA